MPVVVTGASGLVGRHLVAALAGVASEVRAYVRRREAAPPLRALGAKVAVGEIGDAETLEVVLRGAHTVCHLVGGLASEPGAYEREIVGTLRAVVEAAASARVARVLYLSYPGAAPGAANPYLRAKARAEELLAGCGLEFAVIRCTHVYGPGSRWLDETRRMAARRPSLVVGPGTQTLAPVFVEDVAGALVAADDRAGAVGSMWGLEGPDRVTADELADLVAGRRRPRFHLSPRTVARMSRMARRPVSEAMLEVLAADSLTDAPDAASALGVVRTPLRDGLARSLAPGPGLEG
ncbi:MAG: NAD(P)H-binding protein [Actinobacteria bacterium]|nr:NAD(P)H-binding protein [Actinomycetota bacterium]